jgi:restriction endonuclease S subunit
MGAGIHVHGQKFCSFSVDSKELAKAPMWDTRYFHPKYIELLKKINSSGFQVVDLKEICLEPIRRGRTPEYSEKGIPVIKVANLKNERIEGVDSFVSEEFYDRNPLARIGSGDILIASTGVGSVGKVDIYESKGKAVADNHVSIVRVDGSKVNPHYVLSFLRSSLGRTQMERACRGATGQIELYPSEIGSIKIPIPPREIQDRIAATMQEAYRERQRLLREADEVINQAKEEVERMIIGGI